MKRKAKAPRAKSGRQIILAATKDENPLELSMLVNLLQLTPEWKPFEDQGKDALSEVALSKLVAADVVELGILAEVRCKGRLFLQQAFFTASGHGMRCRNRTPHD